MSDPNKIMARKAGYRCHEDYQRDVDAVRWMLENRERENIKINEEKEMTIKDFFHLCENNEGTYQIETPDGWKDINFLVKKKNRECYNLVSQSGKALECSGSHQVISNGEWKKVEDIDIENDTILTKEGEEFIVAKEYVGMKDTYDLQVDSSESRYYSNDIISHNCGKSLTCKAVSSLWNMPLLRLDFGKMFHSHIGASEENIRNAIKMAESVAPSILWIDEIEKGISGVRSSGSTDGGTSSRVFSTFLTWMQEKDAQVFVVATANDYNSIPAEFLRAGRFDEIFFVDIPNYSERKEIFIVQLRKKGHDIDEFDIRELAKITDKYSGAEIEKAIDKAMLRGFAENMRKITTDDIKTAISAFKPLAIQRGDEFEGMADWAEANCVPASGKEDQLKAPNLNIGDIGSIDIE